MKGLLHRLAARAAGAAAAVHSDARLPFGRTGLGPDFGRDAAHAGAEQPIALDVGVPAPEASAVFAQPRDGVVADPPPPRRPQMLPADASPRAAPDTRSDAHPRLGDASPSSSIPTQLLGLGPNLPPDLPRRLVDGTPADQGHASHRARSMTESAESAERFAAAPAPAALRSDIAAPFAREPSLLIPLAAPPAIAAPPITRWPGITDPAAHAAASGEPSEVHIHIGRIEVSAVHEAAPPRRPPAPRPLPMSLDAYLAKRGRT